MAAVAVAASLPLLLLLFLCFCVAAAARLAPTTVCTNHRLRQTTVYTKHRLHQPSFTLNRALHQSTVYITTIVYTHRLHRPRLPPNHGLHQTTAYTNHRLHQGFLHILTSVDLLASQRHARIRSDGTIASPSTRKGVQHGMAKKEARAECSTFPGQLSKEARDAVIQFLTAPQWHLAPKQHRPQLRRLRPPPKRSGGRRGDGFGPAMHVEPGTCGGSCGHASWVK